MKCDPHLAMLTSPQEQIAFLFIIIGHGQPNNCPPRTTVYIGKCLLRSTVVIWKSWLAVYHPAFMYSCFKAGLLQSKGRQDTKPYQMRARRRQRANARKNDIMDKGNEMRSSTICTDDYHKSNFATSKQRNRNSLPKFSLRKLSKGVRENLTDRPRPQASVLRRLSFNSG